MFCPSCGTHHETPPRYCKSCGCNLLRISAALVEDPLSAEMATVRENHLKRSLRGGVLSLAIVLAILWSLAFGVGQIKSDEFIPFASIVSWIAVMVFVANLLVSNHLKKVDLLKLNRPDATHESSIKAGPDLLLDHGWRGPSLSVTEQTTELLGEEVRQPGSDVSDTRYSGYAKEGGASSAQR